MRPAQGWFNLHESNMETYEFSKLKKFLTLTRFLMEDTLRFLVEESLSRYVSFLTTAAAPKITVLSTACVETDGVPTGAVGAVGPAAPAGGAGAGARKPPLLLIELQTTKDGTRFMYNTPLESIVQKASTIFDHAVAKVRVGS